MNEFLRASNPRFRNHPRARPAHSSLAFCLTVLLIYDYALTFSMEVKRIWVPHKVSAATAIYFLNRYVGFFGYMPVLYQFLAVVPTDVCRLTSTSPPVSVLTSFSPAGVSAIGCLSRRMEIDTHISWRVRRCPWLEGYSIIYTFLMIVLISSKLVISPTTAR